MVLKIDVITIMNFYSSFRLIFVTNFVFFIAGAWTDCGKRVSEYPGKYFLFILYGDHMHPCNRRGHRKADLHVVLHIVMR